MADLTVKELIKETLEAKGFDGLYDEDCGCFLKDLMPCTGEWSLKCMPGYKAPCPNDPDIGCIGPRT